MTSTSTGSGEGPKERPFLRPFRHGDEDELADICLRTGDSGADATSLYRSSGLLADIFVLPYVARHPESAFVIEGPERVVGYVVCAPNTVAFDHWFRDEWWPGRSKRHRASAAESRKDAALLRYADAVGKRPGSFLEEYPAHLHIDLLPAAQGKGAGRKLINVLVTHLRDHGVPGVQLTTGARNAGAIAFYTRMGFDRLHEPEGAVTFGKRLSVPSID
ncbi:GNAT family N-acetyltransferase [Microbacterium aurugineum]|uniref:GNAT family N-acetyltransferase n=1 Tax=Microbacterium aurugineum TaxID=2851642 RepID=UPI0020BF0431|nr:GNAT family N-acetyltransferase [Microbacterium aurugineum]MCK8475781.1 GNAT family N-acetyltransferase [Microbacterium aurugineum]